jgi:hypothetical protein
MLGNVECHTTHEKKYLISLLCLFPLHNNIQSSGEIQRSVVKYVTAKRKSLEYKTYLGNVIYFHLQLNSYYNYYHLLWKTLKNSYNILMNILQHKM